jgi:hypothetical protein
VHVRRLFIVAALLLAVPISAVAQDFGVMESAETINRGNYKFTVNPLLVFVDPENEGGVAFKFGYGFTPNFDLEGKAAVYDGFTLFGADAEYWLVKGGGIDVSAGAGFHLGRGDARLDTTGIDLTFIASGKLAPRLDLYGAIDLAFESIDDIDVNYDTVHFVPGIEYSISDQLDFVAEVGLALDDDGSHYISGGLAFYIR